VQCQLWWCGMRIDLAALPACRYAERLDLEVVGSTALSHGGATVHVADVLWAASGGPTDALVRPPGTATFACTQVKVTEAYGCGRLSLMVGYNTQVNNEVTSHKYSSGILLVTIVACAPDGVGYQRGRPLCVTFLAVEVLIGRGLKVEEREDEIAPNMGTMMRPRLGPLAGRLAGILPQTYGQHDWTAESGIENDPGVTGFHFYYECCTRGRCRGRRRQAGRWCNGAAVSRAVEGRAVEVRMVESRAVQRWAVERLAPPRRAAAFWAPSVSAAASRAVVRLRGATTQYFPASSLAPASTETPSAATGRERPQ